MKTILISAYAVHPYKGSEDGMGWRFLLEACRRHRVVAVTRCNNRPAIERFFEKNDFPGKQNLHFEYFDLPEWARFWKKGCRGSSLYHWLWHRFLPTAVRRRGLQFDLAHHLNFHCDWTPSHLWKLGKPFIWGPVGHHPALPTDYLLDTGGLKALAADRLKWFFKKALWHFSPGLRRSVERASTIFGMNSSVAGVLNAPENRLVRLPSVGSDAVQRVDFQGNGTFEVLFMGRFVALKGLETVLRAFAQFYQRLPVAARPNVRLHLVGKGDLEPKLREMAQKLGIGGAVEWTTWLPFDEIGAAYRRAAVFFFPSHEGAGMVVAEALAHGVPVLCYQNEGPGELTDDTCAHRIAYHSHSDAIRQFADALADLHQNPEKLAEMRQNAQHFFEKNLTWAGKEAVLTDAYEKAMTAQTQILETENWKNQGLKNPGALAEPIF